MPTKKPAVTSRLCLGRMSRAKSGQRLFDTVWRKRYAADAHSGGVEDRIGDRRCYWADRRLARASRWQFRVIDQHHVHLARRLGDVEDRIRLPVNASYHFVVEGHFLAQRAADALHDVALDAFHQSIRIDDLSTVMGHCELSRPDLAG